MFLAKWLNKFISRSRKNVLQLLKTESSAVFSLKLIMNSENIK